MRKALLERLVEKGYGGAHLANLRRMIDADDSDLFDVLAYIAFALASTKRQERVSEYKSRNLSQYDYKQQAFLDFVLSQYSKEGVGELDQDNLHSLLGLKYQRISDAAAELGSVANIKALFIGFQEHLYAQRRRRDFFALLSAWIRLFNIWA
ncbi:MAG TPA: type I restriction-modification enzyme R subunit C-terminal domain-containing protein [Gammaproteobacteria bacterium]|nr:type I restriction-modification enzyme R subunit C-terminal domain-containing protein [Gammaproteobacteria bacterium]